MAADEDPTEVEADTDEVADVEVPAEVEAETVGAQCLSLHGRLDGMGPGLVAAAGRRWQAAEQDRRWRQDEQAHASARRFWHTAWRTGFARAE